ncbi:MAG: DUF58 domain-containing protein [Planctomycetota bacterium]|nr:DUF58 domain-containing protein [Planctomycetota bacterium]
MTDRRLSDARLQGFVDELDIVDSRRFRIVVRRLADSLGYGTDSSPFLGSGIEYVQSRPYESGDPIRTIDWRVTARTGRFFVKEYESPKRMPVYLVIDTSASMTISSTRHSKYATALFLAGGLALACLERVSPVGVIGAGDSGLRIRPSLSKSRIMEWLLRLRSFRYDEGTHLAERLGEIAPRLTQRVLMIVLSDLHDPAAMGALSHLVQRHDCAVVQLQDPAEVQLRGTGFLRAREAETGREFWTHGRRRHLDQEEIDRTLRRKGIDHLVVRTDRPYVHDARRFFGSRGLLGRGAR